MSLWSIAAVGFAVTVLVTPLVITSARQLGVVDLPGALKPQATPVPYLGGFAVFAGVLAGALSGRPATLVPLVLALALGTADDLADLWPGWRLLGQVAVGALVVVILPLHLPAVLGAAAGVVVTFVVINGVNLVDGLDLLAGGVAAVAAAGFAAILHGAGRDLSVGLGAALLGFLVYNRPPARVYLGDGGAYLIGAALAVLMAFAWAPGVPAAVGIAALSLVAVVVGEVAFAAVRRLRARRSPMSGDRRHPYDRLVDRGWSGTAASLTYIGVEAFLAAGAVAAARAGSVAGAVVVDVAAAAVLVTLAAVTGSLRPDEETTR